MKVMQNEGSIDRMVRILIGLTMLGVSIIFLQDWHRTIIFSMGIILFLTGFVGYCGIYALCGISTIKKRVTNLNKLDQKH